MAPITLVCGALLTALGLFGYFGGSQNSLTALIPSFFGVVFVVLGLLARKDKLRMHAMHAAASLALIGFVVPGIMGFPKLAKRLSGGEVERSAVFQSIMAVICALFLALCIRSFIMARRARRGETTSSGG